MLLEPILWVFKRVLLPFTLQYYWPITHIWAWCKSSWRCLPFKPEQRKNLSCPILKGVAWAEFLNLLELQVDPAFKMVVKLHFSLPIQPFIGLYLGFLGAGWGQDLCTLSRPPSAFLQSLPPQGWLFHNCCMAKFVHQKGSAQWNHVQNVWKRLCLKTQAVLQLEHLLSMWIISYVWGKNHFPLEKIWICPWTTGVNV